MNKPTGGCSVYIADSVPKDKEINYELPRVAH